MKRLMCILLSFGTLASSGCQYFGASIMAFSHAASPEKYEGPVYAVAGDDPADGWASLQTHYDPADGPVVLADFEHNAVLPDGTWDTADHNAYRAMVKYAPTGGSCMVIVKGWRDGGPEAGLTAARADIDAIAATRVSPTVVVDWKPVAEAHPSYYGSDPIHPNAAGLDAYADLIASGLNQCPS